MSGVIGLYATAIVVGWVGGGLVNWAAAVLPGAHNWRTAMSALWLNRRTYWAPARQMDHWRSPVVILVSIGLTVLFAWRYGWDAALGIAWLYGLFLLAVAVIDFEHHRVLNIMLAPAVFVIAIFSLLPATPDPVNMLLGGAVGFGVFLLLGIIGRGALGLGDVKLAGLIGMMTGFPGVIYALLWGAILGGAAAVILLVSRKATRKTAIAYAPYLVLGAIYVMWLTA
jgi:prepilin signal peptidase PulO-like enzyme (type II secretory pathway)